MEYTVLFCVVIVSLTTLHETNAATCNCKTVVFKTPMLKTYITEATKNLTRDVLKKYLFDNSEAMGRFGGKLERIAEKLLEKEVATIEKKLSDEGQLDHVLTTAIEPNVISQGTEDQNSDAYQVYKDNPENFDLPSLSQLIKWIAVDNSTLQKDNSSESSNDDSALDTKTESTLAPSTTPEDTNDVESTTRNNDEETPVSQLKGLLKVLRSHNMNSTATRSWQAAQSARVTEGTQPDTSKSTTAAVSQESTEPAVIQDQTSTEPTKPDTSKSTTRQEYEYDGSEEPHSSASTEGTKPDASNSTGGPSLEQSAEEGTYSNRRIGDASLMLPPQELPHGLDIHIPTKSTEKKLPLGFLQQTLKSLGLELVKAIQTLQEHHSSAE